MISIAALLLLLSGCACHRADGFQDCCSIIPKKQRGCKDACQKVWMSDGSLQRLENLAFVFKACPSIKNWDQVSTCINSAYPVLQDVDVWDGRACCELALSSECRSACGQARSNENIAGFCKKNDEQRLHACLARQEGSQTCCRSLPSSRCRVACRAVFARDGPPTSELSKVMQELCSDSGKPLIQCVANHTQMLPPRNPSESLHCCHKGADQKCRDTCSRALLTLETELDIVNALIVDCREPEPLNPMWQCFLVDSRQRQESSAATGSVAMADASSVDGARLLCCGRARKLSCRQLCWQVYGGRADGRTSAMAWSDFSRECQYEPDESSLAHCIQEVEEPCLPGCSGMQFCRTFNNRPTDMFRTCTQQADQAARRDYETWVTSRTISLPNLKIALKDLTKCEPDLWKTVACALQVKPCKQRSHNNRICKSDCLHILNKCVDFSQISGQTANSLCDHLPVSENDEDCIFLGVFTNAKPADMTVLQGVTHPCRPNPCNGSHACEVNREPCTNNGVCKPYICLPACLIGSGSGGGGGEASAVAVKHGYHVRVPESSSARQSWVCHRLCSCPRGGGHIGQCMPLDCPGRRPENCYPDEDIIEYLGEGLVIEHEGKVEVGCNECVCHAGILTCSRKSCMANEVIADSGYTGLPCKCSSLYVPVCSKMGKTYANKCLAQCVGLTELDYDSGTCASRNPCKNNPCGAGLKCVVKKHVCLSADAECLQYECISSGPCDQQPNDPVCDTKGFEFKNMCNLLQNRKHLAYRGHCMTHCEQAGVVCGVNGETYANECAALAERVLADYSGNCEAIGSHLKMDSPSAANMAPASSACANIKCLKEIAPECQPITPPGACCPVCGAELSMLYSKAQLKSLIAGSLPPVAVADIAEHLRQYVTVAECDVFGYLSFEDEIVLLILPIVLNPAALQVEACNIEAEKLSTWISSKNPILFIDAKLSILMSSRIRTAKLLSTPPKVSSLSRASNQCHHSSVVIVSLVLCATLLIAQHD